MKAIIPIPADSDFSIYNLPFGIFKNKTEPQSSFRVGIALGSSVIDIAPLIDSAELKVEKDLILASTLNKLADHGRSTWRRLRSDVQTLFSNPSHGKHSDACRKALIPMSDVELKLPFDSRGFTDFYASKNHARHVGELYRSKENALNPNWLHIPIAYNGRANTLFVSGKAIKRPMGQILEDGKPVFSECRKLDFELELGTFIGTSNAYFEPIGISAASDHIFGHVLVNDWSARDIQAWEYVPLGPFLGKSFATSVSPWVVTSAALEPFYSEMPPEEIEPLPYLKSSKRSIPVIHLEVSLIPKGQDKEYLLCKTDTRELYWSFEQMIVHHSSNGTKLEVGDLIASGTVSGDGPGQVGCLLEASFNGKESVTLGEGIKRSFLEDGDTVIMRGYCKKNDIRVGFGELRSMVIGQR